jgi:hypothetical protein
MGDKKMPEITKHAVGVVMAVTKRDDVALGLQMEDGTLPGCLMAPETARSLAMQLLSCADKAGGKVSRSGVLQCALEVTAQDGHLVVRMCGLDGVWLECPLGPLERSAFLSSIVQAMEDLDNGSVANG